MDFFNIINGSLNQLFPGAYIFNGYVENYQGAVPIPIYRSSSIPGWSDQYRVVENKNKQTYVLPGFKIIVYGDPNYQGSSFTVDNTTGTEILFVNASVLNEVNSYKLYFKNVEVS